MLLAVIPHHSVGSDASKRETEVQDAKIARLLMDGQDSPVFVNATNKVLDVKFRSKRRNATQTEDANQVNCEEGKGGTSGVAIKGGMSTTRKRVDSTENVRLLPEEVHIMGKLQRQDHVYELHIEEPIEISPSLPIAIVCLLQTHLGLQKHSGQMHAAPRQAYG